MSQFSRVETKINAFIQNLAQSLQKKGNNSIQKYYLFDRQEQMTSVELIY